MPDRAFADTNLFLRYLTNDIPDQADAVERLLRAAGNGRVLLVTNGMVIAEIVWVLYSYYKLGREETRQKALAILNTPGLEVVERELVLQAITWWAEQNVDFIDAYNAAWLLAHGMTTAYTFDHVHFSRFSGVKVRVPHQDVPSVERSCESC